MAQPTATVPEIVHTMIAGRLLPLPLRIVLNETREMREKSMINARRSICESVMDTVSHTGVHFSDEKNFHAHSLRYFS
jgi:hypothetical protein